MTKTTTKKTVRKRASKTAPEPALIRPDDFRSLGAQADFFDAIQATTYDAATPSDLSRKVFLNCDDKSADASVIPEVRRRLREFARKEVANNSYARGLVLILSGDMIGTGPKLQIAEDGLFDASMVEDAFHLWAEEVKLAEKLKSARVAKMVDGETFGFFYRDLSLVSSSKLNLRFVESECVSNPYAIGDLAEDVDGVFIDENGDPTKYRVLTEHPGGLYTKQMYEYVDVPAENTIHWYRVDRPGQHRGVSEFAPVLPLFYMLRNYTLSVVRAAEAAASIPFVLYTDNPAVTPYVPHDEDYFTGAKLRPGMMTILPDAWRLGQVNPSQPTTTYPEFKREVLAEIARCFCVPVNVLSGDSSNHNYASGRLDFQTYHKMLDVERRHCESNVLSKIFEHWFEQTYFRGKSPKYWGFKRIPKATWLWDGFPHVDPAKEAASISRQLASGTLTYAEVLAKKGVDWKPHFDQLKRERDYLKKIGVDLLGKTNK